MSMKAYKDLQRLRAGILVWGRELPSRWSGHGNDYSPSARYVVQRSNDTGLWSAIAPGGAVLSASARTAAIAKDACQEHHDKSRKTAGRAPDASPTSDLAEAAGIPRGTLREERVGDDTHYFCSRCDAHLFTNCVSRVIVAHHLDGCAGGAR